MNDRQPSDHGIPPHVPLMALLGLRDPDGGDWNRLRAVQFSQIRHTAPLRIAVHAACATIVIWTFFGIAPVLLSMAFALLLGSSLLFTIRADRILSSGDRPRIGRAA